MPPALLPYPLASHSLLASPLSPPSPWPSAVCETEREGKKKEKREREREEADPGHWLAGRQGARQGRLGARDTQPLPGPSGLRGMYVRSATCEPVCAGAGRHALLCQTARAGSRCARQLRLPARSPHQLAGSGVGDG